MKAVARILFSFGTIASLVACSSSSSPTATATLRPQPTTGATRTPVPTTAPTGTAVSPTSTTTDQTPEPTASPPPVRVTTFSDAVSREKGLSTFAAAIAEQGIDIDQVVAEAIDQQSGGRFTFFAPANEAISALDPVVRESLLSDPEMLRQFIRHAVINDAVPASDFWKDIRKTALDGTLFELKLEGASAKVIDLTTQVTASVVLRDIRADTGLVQVTDRVLLPSTT